MDHVQVEVVGAHALERAVDRAHDVRAGEAAVGGVLTHRVEHLGGEHQALTRSHLEEVAADHFFVTTGGIPVGHVEEIDAEVERPPQDRNRFGLIEHPALPRGAAHRHGAETELRNLEAGLTEADQIHA